MADQAQASGGYDEVATLHGSALHRRVTRLLWRRGILAPVELAEALGISSKLSLTTTRPP